ncbi:caspase-8-like [Chanos chanos]|uniref:Caspase-8 n=1 Tax=Chanos chanos TaxID=29144 RepID=A0A6J2VBL4_CHACN|nr:caspase-8-like [Chanos chanos]
MAPSRATLLDEGASWGFREPETGRGPRDPRADTAPEMVGPSTTVLVVPGSRAGSRPPKTCREREPRRTQEFYALTRRPCGLCLIINNYDFQSRSSLRNHEGTQKALTRVFTRMRFLVREKKDLSRSEILRVVKEFAEKNHSAYDAFVCCVLSHGEKGSILGTDGEDVQIRDLTQPFACCNSLKQKPKIFFIQACQGKKHQQDTPVQTDGYTDDEIQEDALDSACRKISLEDDFPIGMATVEDCVSFRQRQKGSLYIQELCKQLETSCPRRENILTILTRVNRNISQGVFPGRKQMPEPRFTLTKTLVFPWG